MKTIKFHSWTCRLTIEDYPKGNKRINLTDAKDGLPVATATAWIPGLEKDEFAIKDYSENQGEPSITMMSEKEIQAIEYAKNYPHVVVDTNMMGPISVGNVNTYNDRVIINLCLRTAKSYPRNATISYPQDWAKASQFKPGDQVNVQIEKGLVKRIWHAKAEPVKTFKPSPVVSAATVNAEVGTAMEELEADKALGEVIKEALELVPQEADTNTDDLPF